MSGRMRFLFLLITVSFYCTSTPIFVNTLYKKLEGDRADIATENMHFDAVVVLAGMVSLGLSTEHTEEFGSAVDRIIKGMDLVREKQADFLVISGGSGELIGATLSESKVLRNFAIRFGIPKEKILIDAGSRNTRENALMTKVLLETHDLKEIALVTSAFHIPRAMGCFRAVGLVPTPIPVDYHASHPNKKDIRNYFPKVSALNRFGSLAHELVGIVVYGFRGYADYQGLTLL